MLESICWADYFQYSSAAIASYYGFVGAVFYRKELLQLIRRPNIRRDSNRPVERPAPTGSDPEPSSIQADQSLMPRAHECVDELNALLLQMAKENSTEQLLTSSLQRLLQKYPDLQHSSFQESITQLISEQSQTQCGITLPPTAIARLWP